MFYIYNKVNNLVVSKLDYKANINSESYGCIEFNEDKDFIISEGIDTTTNLPIIKRLKFNGDFYYE